MESVKICIVNNENYKIQQQFLLQHVRIAELQQNKSNGMYKEQLKVKCDLILSDVHIVSGLFTDLYKYSPDAVPPIHAVSSHVATDKPPPKMAASSGLFLATIYNQSQLA